MDLELAAQGRILSDGLMVGFLPMGRGDVVSSVERKNIRQRKSADV
jgi:hypothetical protein